jgi:hypothetical protein
LLGAAALLATAQAMAAEGPVVQRAAVTPTRGFTDSADGVRIEFRISGGTADVAIKIAGGGREVRRIELRAVQPGTDRTQIWDGLDNTGHPVADGTYRVIVAIPGGKEKEAGAVLLRGHFFPVRGAARGARRGRGIPRAAQRRALASRLRRHRGLRHAPSRRHDGHGREERLRPPPRRQLRRDQGIGGRRKYWYAHMLHPSRFDRGDLVHVGEVVGHIGRTGNAGSTPCHLHVEIHRRGKPIDPEPSLRAWDRDS